MRLDHNIFYFTENSSEKRHSRYVVDNSFAYYSGGYGGEVPPVPIPNTEVKLSCADGTAWVTVWESRELPGFLKKPLH